MVYVNTHGGRWARMQGLLEDGECLALLFFLSYSFETRSLTVLGSGLWSASPSKASVPAPHSGWGYRLVPGFFPRCWRFEFSSSCSCGTKHSAYSAPKSLLIAVHVLKLQWRHLSFPPICDQLPWHRQLREEPFILAPTRLQFTIEEKSQAAGTGSSWPYPQPKAEKARKPGSRQRSAFSLLYFRDLNPGQAFSLSLWRKPLTVCLQTDTTHTVPHRDSFQLIPAWFKLTIKTSHPNWGPYTSWIP